MQRDSTSSALVTVSHTIVGLVTSICWIAGAVIAQGWYKVLAAFFPPYAWYKLVELYMQRAGLI